MNTPDVVAGSEPDGLPSMVQVRRSDPVYMAHAYLTKVPVTAIAPFIEAFTEPGDVVLDPFAGSGMTGGDCRAGDGSAGGALRRVRARPPHRLQLREPR